MWRAGVSGFDQEQSSMIRVIAIAAWMGLTSGAAGATIPEPDVIIYGQVCLAGGPATDADDVSVIARAMIDNEVRDVGSYRMGQQPSASDCNGDADCFVLRVRLETVPPGEDPSGTAVVLNSSAPATVELFVKEGSSAEMPAGQLAASDRGLIRRFNLSAAPLSTDINDDTHRDMADYSLLRGAFTGPATQTTQPCDPTDINRDGHVDLLDYAFLQAEFTGEGG
jgi:hypothetical protein